MSFLPITCADGEEVHDGPVMEEKLFSSQHSAPSSPLLQQVKEKRLEPPGDVGRADDGPVEGGELQGPGVERGQRAQGVVCRD